MKTARQFAAESLLKLETRRAWSNLLWDRELQKENLTSRDSAFAGALFYGVLERKITLLACVAAHSRIAPEKLDPAVRVAVLLGLYQLLYMDSVPPSAAVNESVELVRRLRKTQAAGFVNGVLRSFLRADKAIPLPDDPIERLGVEYSCPAGLARLWVESYGEQAARRILAGSLGRPPLTIRVNLPKISPDELIVLLKAEGVEAVPDSDLPACLSLEKTGAVAELAAFREGLFHVQDKASQLCVLALGPKPGERILDCCAAPGGKAFTIAQELCGQGEVVACDLYPHRVGLIAKGALQLSLPAVHPEERDMSLFHPELGGFDRVLCDLPCSGLGVIRHKPEIKYKDLDEFSTLPNLQYKILEMSSHYLKAGGTLLYSTCTLNPAENEQVTDRFSKAHPEFEPLPLPWPLGPASSRTLLGELGADGFFLASFVKKG